MAYSPIYFNTQPNLQLSLSDVNILDALTLKVKTHGYNYAAGSELICLPYRIYYKLLSTLNPKCRLYDVSYQTILIETNFAKSKVTTRRPIRWDEIDFPTTWTLNSVIPPSQVTINLTNSDFSHVTQNPDGRICIQFNDNSTIYNRRSFSQPRLLSAMQHISPVEPLYGPARKKAGSLHTINTNDDPLDNVEKVKINPKTNIVQDIDNISDKDIPTTSKMSFHPNNT